MNKQALNLFILFVVFCALSVLSGAVYTLDETQQAVITQFGEAIGRPVTQAGLHFKKPFIQTVTYFDKRILNWDGDPNQIPTLDKRYIWVDTTARWRIVDALKFMQSVGSESAALTRLGDIIDATTRDAVSGLLLAESLRDSNRLLEKSSDPVPAGEASDSEVGATSLDPIEVGREKLTRDILARASQIITNYGIELVDVRIKRINYIQEVQNKVYERMISERKRAAEQYRAEGQGKKAEIEGQISKELQEIRSEAYRKAQEIRGDADAEAAKIYAEAYNKDPEFYNFVKTLETYPSTIGKDTTLFLSTEADYFKYLKTMALPEQGQ